MSLAIDTAERAKFEYLLELALEQVQALEREDMCGFDRILSAKRGIIESMHDTRRLMDADPTLEGVITRIKDADVAARKLLYLKMGQIMREMDTLNRKKKARSAYTADRSPTKRIRAALPDSSSYMDTKS